MSDERRTSRMEEGRQAVRAWSTRMVVIQLIAVMILSAALAYVVNRDSLLPTVVGATLGFGGYLWWARRG